jgi:hypothetical protein
MSESMRSRLAAVLSIRNLQYAAAFAICILYFSSLHFDPTLSRQNDLYFGADGYRVLENLKDSNVDWTHSRDRLHPFFSIFAVSTAQIPAALGIAGREFMFYRLVFGTAGTMLFFALIYLETSPLQAFASLTLLLSTMSMRVFATLPESFLFGFFTLMLTLNLIRLRANPVAVLIASMTSASTNIVLGGVHVLRSLRSFRQAVQIALAFAAVALCIDIVQINVYPTSDYFFNVLALSDETRYLARTIGALPFRAFDFLFSGFVMPLQQSLSPPIDARGEWGAYLTHGFMSKRATLAVGVSIALLAILYAASIYAFVADRMRTDVKFALAGFIVFEFLFNMIYGESAYGDSPFLFSLHYTPLILVFFSLNRVRRIAGAYPLAFLGLAMLLQYVNLTNFAFIFHA